MSSDDITTATADESEGTPLASATSQQQQHGEHPPIKPKEVDIACGLGKTAVLAMECKVSNDATNSIKRMDEVLNKAQAWKVRWGMSVETAALLQGVIAPKEMHRLMTFDVRIFWSHRLGDFMDWIGKRVQP